MKALQRNAAAGMMILLLAACVPAGACYSGLTVIPTAEVVGADTYSLELQIDGRFDSSKDDTYLLNTEFGFGDRFEAGVDFDVSEGAETRLFLNGKYIVQNKDDGRRMLAVGICNVGEGARPSLYVAGLADFDGLRAHAGIIRIESKNRGFVGFDYALDERYTAMVDYTGGEENYSSVGLNYQFSDQYGLLAGALFPNGGGETLFSLHVVVAGPFRLD